jgi:hypothetical protein
MARLNWSQDRRRRLAREAAAPKSYEERKREREVARATSRFFAQHPSTSRSRPKTTARRLKGSKGSSTTKLPFLATINAGGRVHTVEVGRYGVRFVGPGEREAYTQSS